jgi:hypothetical protein|tara:strand:- start:1091 stop:1288 length:198 start_codon:yes stop_codon:yes gene_type:complete
MTIKILKEIVSADGSIIKTYMLDELGEVLSFSDAYEALNLIALLNKNADSKTTYSLSSTTKKDEH